MTLTAALRAALDTNTKEAGIAAFTAIYGANDAPDTPKTCAAEVFLYLFGRADWVRGWLPLTRIGMTDHGADLTVLDLTKDDPAWTAAAERLAAWADGVAK